MGKAAFVHLSDGVTRLQIYLRSADVTGVRNDNQGGEVDGWRLFELLDHGDFIGVEGYLFITRTGELSVHVQKLQFLAKALLPLPDKMHGINDPEIRQRQRYADLIAGSLKLDREADDLNPREVFERRSAIIRELRGEKIGFTVSQTVRTDAQIVPVAVSGNRRFPLIPGAISLSKLRPFGSGFLIFSQRRDRPLEHLLAAIRP